jgi:hypothetical protein
MRRIISSAVTLILMVLSFAAGRVTDGFRNLPNIAATLPGDESEFSRELNDRVHERFSVGTSEENLIDALASEGFAPEWRRRDNPNVSSFVRNGLICKKIVRVSWRADSSGILIELNGAYESQCL